MLEGKISIKQKTHPYLHKDGKNCYEKENHYRNSEIQI